MGSGEICNEFNRDVETDPDHAQILIDIPNSAKGIEEAWEIIGKSGVRIIRTKYLSSNFVLFVLNVKDMREIALKLTELGFCVSGFNAAIF